MTTPHINQLREHLLGALSALRDRDNPMEPDRARAMAQVASVVVDTARVEVEYLKLTGQEASTFLEQPTGTTQLTTHGQGSPFPPGITNVTRHRLGG